MYAIKILEKLDSIEKKLSNRLSDKWLNIKQICEYTTLSESTIRREVSKGVLKVSRKTGRLLFNINDVKKWLSNG